MNALSWVLYLADVVGNVSLTFGAIGFFGVFIAIISIAFYMFAKASTSDRNENSAREAKAAADATGGFLKWFLPLWLVSIIIWAVIPSRNTVLLIATSQTAEQIVNLEEVQALGGEVGELATNSIRYLSQEILKQIEVEESE